MGCQPEPQVHPKGSLNLRYHELGLNVTLTLFAGPEGSGYKTCLLGKLKRTKPQAACERCSSDLNTNHTAICTKLLALVLRGYCPPVQTASVSGSPGAVCIPEHRSNDGRLRGQSAERHLRPVPGCLASQRVCQPACRAPRGSRRGDRVHNISFLEIRCIDR